MCGNTAMSSCILPFSIKLLTILTKAMLGHQAEVLFEAGKCSCCPPCCVAQKSLRPHSKLDDGTELMGNCPTTYLYPLSSPPATPPPPPPRLFWFCLCCVTIFQGDHLIYSGLFWGEGYMGFSSRPCCLKVFITCALSPVLEAVNTLLWVFFFLCLVGFWYHHSCGLKGDVFNCSVLI